MEDASWNDLSKVSAKSERRDKKSYESKEFCGRMIQNAYGNSLFPSTASRWTIRITGRMLMRMWTKNRLSQLR